MAKILSHPYSIIRGSVGGTTYLSGPHNAIIARQRTSPVNPSTNRQQSIRAGMAQAHVVWLALTDAQRDDWNTYALTVSVSSPLGNYNPSGQEIFIAYIATAVFLNTEFTASLNIAGAPPIIPGLHKIGAPIASAPSAPGTGFQLTVGNPDSAAAIAHIRVSGAYNPTRNFFKGPYDPQLSQILPCAATAGTPVDIIGLTDSLIYFVSVRLFDSGTLSRISAERTVRVVAQTNP